MEAIVNHLITATGWTILHSLWQGAIIFAIVLILFSFKNLSAKLRHNIAFAGLLFILISASVTFATLFTLPSKQQSDNTEAFFLAVKQVYSYTNSLTFKTENYFPYLVSLYTLGIVFQFVVLVAGYLKLKRLKKYNVTAFPAQWLTVAEKTVAKLNLKKNVNFQLSSVINVPVAIGFLKPVVLFPIALVNQLEIKHVEAILIHELSHIRRNDYILNIIKTGIETLLFFNPFVWLTSRLIHIEREHDCDDLVVNLTDAPVSYAHTLLKLALIKNKTTPALSLAATGQNQHLYQRIKRITNMKTNYTNAKQKIIVLGLTFSTLFSLAWINPSAKNKLINKELLNVKTAINKYQNTVLKADTDTVKKKKQFKAIIKDKDGKETTYTNYDEMPDSVKAKLKGIDDKFNSPEWKKKMARIERESLAIEKKFNSPEWKKKMDKIEKQSLAIEKKFNSPEWKEKMARIERESLAIEKEFNSPEWKEKMAKIEKENLAMEKKFNSPEWKEKMAKIEKQSLAIEKKFNSPEWKEKMAKIEKQSLELQKKFNSPEWKKKFEDIQKLQDSKEYKELREKYEKDLNELKKKNGISTEQTSLTFDFPMQIANLLIKP